MNNFEKVLLNFGPAVFSACFHIAEAMEMYEDCYEMKFIADKYEISLTTSLEDWQACFWRRGFSGQTALSNTSVYLEEAMKLIGYS